MRVNKASSVYIKHGAGKATAQFELLAACATPSAKMRTAACESDNGITLTSQVVLRLMVHIVADLWKEALKSYKNVLGFDLTMKFANVAAMKTFGVAEMDGFHKFRHNDKKVDQLRTLFSKNIDYLQAGANQLVSAATPAFPPAAAIGTAITFIISVSERLID